MGRHRKTRAGRARALTASVVISTTCAGSLLALAGSATAAPDREKRLLGLLDDDPGNAAPDPAPEPVAPDGSVRVEVHPTAPAPASAGQRIVEAAASQAGAPYAYGGTGPRGFDCSGFTQYAHRQAGIELPRSSAQQAAAVPAVSKSEAQPGDLLFFHGRGGGVYHAAIYAGNNRMWTAPQTGDVVKLQPIYSQNYTVGRAW